MVYMGCFGLESQEGGIAFSLCRTTEGSRSQQSLFLLDAVVLWRHTSPVSCLVEMRVIRETEKHSFGRGLIPGYPNIESMVPAELGIFGGLSFFLFFFWRGRDIDITISCVSGRTADGCPRRRRAAQAPE